jgi:hypothetical protein
MTPAEKAQHLINVLRTNELEWRYKAMRERSELAGMEASHKQWEADRLNDEYGGPGPGDFRNPYSSLEPKQERVKAVESSAADAADVLNFAIDHFLKYVT